VDLQQQHRIIRRQESGDWLVLRHSDIRNALNNPDLIVTPPRTAPKVGAGTPLEHLLTTAVQSQRLWLSQQDAPDHDRLRQVVQPLYGPPQAERLLSSASQTASELAKDLAQHLGFDLVQDFSAPLAQMIIGGLFDVPPTMTGRLGEWSQHILRALELDQAPLVYQQGLIALGKFHAYFSACRANGTLAGDVFAGLISGIRHGTLTEDEAIAQSVLLYVSGHTTTQDLIGSAVLYLARDAALKQRMRDDPSDLFNMVRETARLQPPTQYVVRWARDDCVLFDQKVAAGDRVLLMIAAGNRDPEVFPDPDAFDPDRKLHQSLALGDGAHSCVGGHIALRIAECAAGT